MPNVTLETELRDSYLALRAYLKEHPQLVGLLASHLSILQRQRPSYKPELGISAGMAYADLMFKEGCHSGRISGIRELLPEGVTA